MWSTLPEKQPLLREGKRISHGKFFSGKPGNCFPPISVRDNQLGPASPIEDYLKRTTQRGLAKEA